MAKTLNIYLFEKKFFEQITLKYACKDSKSTFNVSQGNNYTFNVSQGNNYTFNVSQGNNYTFNVSQGNNYTFNVA